jgi:flavin reductase (DIM6/NTAB) family NADH-FMN oxidoreductase RutF
LCGNAATIECKPWRIYDGGDHLIVIGEVIDLQINEADPLLFVSGKFREVGGFSGGSPWEASGDSMVMGWFEGSTSFPSF